MKENNNFANSNQQSLYQLQSQPHTPYEIDTPISSSTNPRYDLAPIQHGRNQDNDITNDIINQDLQIESNTNQQMISNNINGRQAFILQQQQDVPGQIQNYQDKKQYQQYQDEYIYSQIPPDNNLYQDIEQLAQQRLTLDEEQKLQQLVNIDPNDPLFENNYVPNYDLDFNFEGFHHQDLIEKNLNMQCFLQTYTSRECIVCHPMLQFMYQNNAIMPHPIQDKQINSVKQLPQIISDNLHKKYMTSKDFYNVKIVNDIIYNEPTHIVAVFKDYLIYDDLSEFLKRYYDEGESITRLPKICEFYEKYSKVFPNYVILPESKLMFKNIERKQKIIDDKQKCLQAKVQVKEEKIKKKMMKLNGGIMPSNVEIGPTDLENYESSMSWFKNSLRFFDTKFIDSVLKQDPLPSSNTQHSSFIQKSLLLDQSQRRYQNTSTRNKSSNQLKSFAELNLEQLVQAFISKDFNHQNSINQSNITATLDITMPSFHQQDESEKFIKSMLEQQQKQKEVIKKQMQQRKENQKLILTNKPKPQLLAQQQINNVKAILQQQQDQQKLQQQIQTPQTIVTQSGQKFVFNTSNVTNPYLNKQKQYFEKMKTDSKRKSSQGNSLQGSPQMQNVNNSNMKISPPKVQQQIQQIYGLKETVPTLKQSQIKQAIIQKDQQILDNKAAQIVKKKVKKQAVGVVNLNHQQPDYKIKHGFNVPQNIAFNQLTSSQSGSITQRESLQQKLINNLIMNQNQQYQSNFSPLDIQDVTTTNNKNKQKIFNYNIQDPNKLPYQIGSQSARLNNEIVQVPPSKLKHNVSLSKDTRGKQGGGQNVIHSKLISPLNATKTNSQIRTSNEYKTFTGNMIIPSVIKANSQDRERYQSQANGQIQNIKHKNINPDMKNRITDLIRGGSENQRLQKRSESPFNYFEESKQIDVSNTLHNQTTNQMYNYTNQQQKQLAQKFMNKRNSFSKQQQENYQNPNQAMQMSQTISHGNSGYNTQQTNSAQNLQQTNNSSSHTNQIMKVMQLDIADISTNLNNNSRNFLARQQQQQLQKQSRGMNPRQKSVPKSKKTQPHQNLIFVGESNHLYGSQVQNMNNQTQLQQMNSGRQSPSTARNSSNNNQVMFEINPIQNPQYQFQQQFPNQPQMFNTNTNRLENNSNTIIQNSRHIIKKVLQNTKNAQIKSNSQNRVRDNSPMDYQVQLLGSTLQQDTTNQRIKPERQSLDRAAKIGLPYQQQMQMIGERRHSNKRYSIKGPQSNQSPTVVEQQSTSRTRQSLNNPNPKKIIIGKKQNIFGAIVTKTGKIL